MSHRRKFLLGSVSNMVKGALAVLVTLVLPPLLVHRLAPAEYSVWVLILQCSAYIALLELSLQTAIGKFVAQYDALGDRAELGSILSSSFALLSISAVAGICAVAALSWYAPHLFQQVPPGSMRELQLGLLLVGMSTALALPSSAFIATFTGLQEYGVSTLLAIGSKLLSTAALVLLLLSHGTLLQLAAMMAFFNLATALTRYLGWRYRVRERVDFSFSLIRRQSAVRLMKYGSVLSISALGMFFVSGLDTVIVGRYDFENTGYYGLAAEATTFMILIILNIFGPLMPAISSLQSSRTPEQLGETTIKVTRYCTLLICFVGLPLFFAGYPILSLWVGKTYAISSLLFLQILIVGNVIRLLGYPYSLVILATGKPHLATLAAVTEAIVNFTLSIYLVQKMGAVGVAIGTFVGSFISIGTHLAVSMHYTRDTASISRRRFVLEGLLRPLTCILPTLCLLPFWSRYSLLPVDPILLVMWIVSTLLIAWFFGLQSAERDYVESKCALLYRRMLANAA